MGSREIFVGNIIEKQTGTLRIAMTLNKKFVGFINVKPNTYLMQWNDKVPIPRYIPIKKSLTKAKRDQQKKMDLLLNKYTSKGYKPLEEIFITS